MNREMYVEKTLHLSLEEAFEVVKRSLLKKYNCRILKEESPRILIIEHFSLSDRKNRAPQNVVFYFYDTNGVTKVVAVSTPDRRLIKNLAFSVVFLAIVEILIILLNLMIPIYEGIIDRGLALASTIVSAVGYFAISFLIVSLYKLHTRIGEVAEEILSSVE